MRQKGFILLPVIIIILIVGVLGYFIYQNTQLQKINGSPISLFLKTKVNTPNPEINKILTEVEKIFQKNAKKYNAKISFSDDEIWWTTEDNLNINIKNTPAVMFSVPCYENFQDEDVYKMKEDLFQIIGKLFIQNGYSLSKANTSNVDTQGQFYYFQDSYEKDDIKCSILTDPQCSSLIRIARNLSVTNYVTCSDQLDKNIAVQKPLIELFNLKESTAEIRDSYGDFRKYEILYRQGSTPMVAKMVDNTWKEIYSTMDQPDCSIVNKYKVPKEIEKDCYLNGVTLIPNPN